MKKWFVEIKNLFENIKVYESWQKSDFYLDVPNIPCHCNTCIKKQHDILWCDRVVRQRQEQRDEYTCPGCQKNFHKDIFDKHYDICTRTNSYLDICPKLSYLLVQIVFSLSTKQKQRKTKTKSWKLKKNNPNSKNIKIYIQLIIQ